MQISSKDELVISVSAQSEPKKPIETGSFDSSIGASAPIANPAKVQTGGFGNPAGVAPSSTGHGNAPVVGVFDLSAGNGKGNGVGGDNGVRGTFVSAGFGDGGAAKSSVGGGPGHAAVQSAGFDATPIPENRSKVRSQESTVQPVEILEKPRPEYTDEARRLKIEGEVLLSVVLRMSGHVEVVSVIRGLGHGLDESAIRAAANLKFKPAMREGQPVDFPATLHISFELTY